MRTIAIVVALFGVIVFSKLYLAEPSASDGRRSSRSSYRTIRREYETHGFQTDRGKEYILSGVRYT